ncbi:hypothetical protein M885DRAFT_14449 [Pelagophyceae sp. CCMP2097]|nr:hypothetical protein M885DRAFT_14449 [Pelagophyceae sp. CCMP2097]
MARPAAPNSPGTFARRPLGAVVKGEDAAALVQPPRSKPEIPKPKLSRRSLGSTVGVLECALGLARHASSAVVALACDAVSNLAYRLEENQRFLGQLGGVEALVEVLRRAPDNDVSDAACSVPDRRRRTRQTWSFQGANFRRRRHFPQKPRGGPRASLAGTDGRRGCRAFGFWFWGPSLLWRRRSFGTTPALLGRQLGRCFWMAALFDVANGRRGRFEQGGFRGPRGSLTEGSC